MFKELRHRRAVARVQPGDGRELKRFRWWQTLFRALFYLRLGNDEGGWSVYAVDVRHWQNQSSGEVKAQLYLDGRQHAQSKLPAVFPVPGGTIEVKMSAFGLKRCHYVTADGAAHQLVPDPDSAEGRRAQVERSHPVMSRCVGVLSLVVLTGSLGILILQLVEQLTRVPPIAAHIGTFASPIDLPVWGNIIIGLIAATASMERALRLRFHWLLDGGAG